MRKKEIDKMAQAQVDELRNKLQGVKIYELVGMDGITFGCYEPNNEVEPNMVDINYRDILVTAHRTQDNFVTIPPQRVEYYFKGGTLCEFADIK